MPKGYLMANITVSDPARYEAYRQGVVAVIEQYGGRFLVRGGAKTQLEGSEVMDRLVVIEFESVEAVHRFYDSPEYAPLLALRKETTRTQLAIVAGVF